MRILFVCQGNTCRSPAAEAVVRQMASEAGLGLSLDSAGLSGERQGAAATAMMQDIALAAGYDLAGLRSRQVTPADYSDFDLMIGMDASVVAALKADLPDGVTMDIAGFMDFVTPREVTEIADPWDTGDYPAAFKLIHAAARAFITELSEDQPRQ